MIKVEMTELPVEKINKIRAWLDKEERGWLENCVAAEIAKLQSEATNLPLEKPHISIGEPSILPPISVDSMKRAAILQSFLNVLRASADAETKFHTVKLTV